MLNFYNLAWRSDPLNWLTHSDMFSCFFKMIKNPPSRLPHKLLTQNNWPTAQSKHVRQCSAGKNHFPHRRGLYREWFIKKKRSYLLNQNKNGAHPCHTLDYTGVHNASTRPPLGMHAP